jgi:hypothetical protein
MAHSLELSPSGATSGATGSRGLMPPLVGLAPSSCAGFPRLEGTRRGPEDVAPTCRGEPGELRLTWRLWPLPLSEGLRLVRTMVVAWSAAGELPPFPTRLVWWPAAFHCKRGNCTTAPHPTKASQPHKHAYSLRSFVSCSVSFCLKLRSFSLPRLGQIGSRVRGPGARQSSAPVGRDETSLIWDIWEQTLLSLPRKSPGLSF